MGARENIQKSIYEALSSSPGVGYTVTDDVEEEQAYPYIVIGEITMTPFDTKDSNGFEAGCVLHSWSRFDGREEVNRMMDSVYEILQDSDLVVEGYNTVQCRFEFDEVLLETDGRTRHGVQRFNLTISKDI